MKRWKEEGERGTFFFGNGFFHYGMAREGKGVIFSYNFIMGGGVG
jgi:hypothetical protein